MRAYHNTRNITYRKPFGAVCVGVDISLTLDIWDAPDSECTLRIWIDGVGERLIPI
jgi:4-alpha-glucanotransferase